MIIKNLLEEESKKRDSLKELSYDKPDPLLVALKYKDEPLKSHLESINNISELNRLYNEFATKLMRQYGLKSNERNFWYNVFISLNILGLLLATFSQLIKKSE
jgi:hypothetical protein